MAECTTVNLREVEDQASKLVRSPHLEARFARFSLRRRNRGARSACRQGRREASGAPNTENRDADSASPNC